MFKLVISDDEGKTTVVPLVRDEVTIGRKEGNTIRLTERNVSRRHARLRKENDAFLVEDLGSYNGIRVNGRRVDGEVTLNSGDQITIGDYLLALQAEGAEDVAATVPSVGPATSEPATAMISVPSQAGPPARLVMLTPPAPGAEFALSRLAMRVGRAEDLDVWVNHRSMSREHAEIRREGDGFHIVDLGSANGVRVNGKEVSESVLRAGDIVELGQVRFRFVAAGEPYTFDADQTVQMDAVAERGSRAPVVAALGIIGVAVVTAAVLALAGEGKGPPGLIETASDPRLSPVSQPTEGERMPALNSLTDAIAACEQALQAQQYDHALMRANEALRIESGSAQAAACKGVAEARLKDQWLFERATSALRAGDIDGAYRSYEQLAADSPFRVRPEVAEAMERYAHNHVEAARAALARNPTAAGREADMVLAMASPPDALRREAEQIRRSARRTPGGRPPTPILVAKNTRVTKAPPTTRPTPIPDDPTETPTPPEEAVNKQPPIETLQACVIRGDHQCVVRHLEGHATTQREIALLIETYRAMGNHVSARRHMQTYVRRFPTGTQAQGYRQILARYGE